MVDIAFYLVTEDIARRSGVIQSRYRTEDGHFILDTKDLSRIHLTSDEYVSGLAGVEKISKDSAMILIKENGYKMGLPIADTQQVVEAPTEVENQTEDEQAQTSEETITNDEVGSIEDVVGNLPNEEQETESETNNEQED